MKRMNIIALIMIAAFAAGTLVMANVGQKLPNCQLMSLQTVEGKEKWGKAGIPYIGTKALTIMYTDVDVADMNDPLSNAIKAKNYPADKYIGIGIGNSKDAPMKPDVFIRMAAKKKMKQFPGSVVLLDENRTFSSTLGLGDCNNKAVVLVVAKDGTIKYLKKIASAAESQAMVPEVLKVLDEVTK